MRFDQLTHADRYDLDQEGVGVPPAFCDNYSAAHEPHTYSAINGRIYRCVGITAAELTELEARANLSCEHGLSLDLCADPVNHYPRDY
jgi:hypothetical protein